MDVQTKTLLDTEHVRVESLADGTPLKRPIYFRQFRKGCYLSTAEAAQIGRELLAAVAKAQAAEQAPGAGRPT